MRTRILPIFRLGANSSKKYSKTSLQQCVGIHQSKIPRLFYPDRDKMYDAAFGCTQSTGALTPGLRMAMLGKLGGPCERRIVCGRLERLDW